MRLRSSLILCAALCTATVIGCIAQEPTVVVNPAEETFQEQFKTVAAPKAAGQVIADVFTRFAFRQKNGNSTTTPVYPLEGTDYFSSIVRAETAWGDVIEARCVWANEHQTDIILTSSLEPERLRYVAKKIQEELEKFEQDPKREPGQI